MIGIYNKKIRFLSFFYNLKSFRELVERAQILVFTAIFTENFVISLISLLKINKNSDHLDVIKLSKFISVIFRYLAA